MTTAKSLFAALLLVAPVFSFAHVFVTIVGVAFALNLRNYVCRRWSERMNWDLKFPEAPDPINESQCKTNRSLLFITGDQAITHERLVCGQNESAFVWTSTKNERKLWRAIWSRAFIFLSRQTYTIKAQRWNKRVYIELALTPFKPLF